MNDFKVRLREAIDSLRIEGNEMLAFYHAHTGPGFVLHKSYGSYKSKVIQLISTKSPDTDNILINLKNKIDPKFTHEQHKVPEMLAALDAFELLISLDMPDKDKTQEPSDVNIDSLPFSKILKSLTMKQIAAIGAAIIVVSSSGTAFGYYYYAYNLKLNIDTLETKRQRIQDEIDSLNEERNKTASESLPNNNNIQFTSRVITGTVDTGTPPSLAWFEYDNDYDRLSDGLGLRMPQVTGSPFIREGEYQVEQTIAGLSPNTTYYYRLVVINAFGAKKANIRQFTTPLEQSDAH